MDFLGSTISWQDKNALETLVRQVAKDGMKVVELGSYAGYSSIILGSIVKEYNGHIWCIDRWTSYPDGDAILDAVYNNNNVYNIFETNLKEAGLSMTVTPIRTNTVDALSKINNELFDFIFIDADHKYHAIIQDITNWYPLLKPNGIMCGHDYDKNYLYKFENVEKYCEVDFIDAMHYGVIRAVDEYFGDRAKFLPERIWYVIK